MLRRLVVLVLASLLAVPLAAAFPAAQEELYIAYGADETPAVVASGALTLRGTATGGLLVADSTTTRLESIPLLRILEDTPQGPRETTLRGATLELLSGSLLWTSPTRAPLALDLHGPHAVGLGLPDAPLPAGEGAPRAGYLLAGEGLTGSARWPAGAEATLVALDARVTLRDASGAPLPGWDGRRVNEGADAANADERAKLLFVAEGPFTARLGARIVAGAAGEGAALELRVARAEEDRLLETLDLLADAGRRFFGGEAFAQIEQLRVLGTVSGILNGALLLVPGPDAEGAAPLEARYGAADFPLGQLSIVRGDDMRLAWEEGEMRVAGEPTVALGRDGFAVDEPRTIGLFPVASIVLWLVALAAGIVWLVRRPPAGRPERGLRLAGFALWALVLVGVFLLWDRSFEQTFGAGVVSTLRDGGMDGATLGKAGVLLMLELVPWGIAGLLFALPVRIALGIGLRYLGRGKSLKGAAAAGGLLALALLGPSYALWCFNLVWSRASGLMP